MRLFQDERIRFQIFSQSFLNTLVNRDFMALSPLLLLDPEAVSDFPNFANELIDPELQKVGYSQSGVDPHHKQQ